MKVAVYYSNDDVRLEERPVPEISAGELLVRMKASGICGTDVMQWYRQKKAPRVLGHEMGGEIVKAGADIKDFRTGDRVFVSHHVPCFRCRYCLNEDFTACEALHSGNYDPGGFSEYIRIPPENVKYGTFILPDTVTDEQASMIEPLGCVVMGQRQLNLKKGQVVLVIGSGISGLLHIQMAKLKGCTVIATDINEYRLRKARELGADHAVNAAEYSQDRLMQLTGGRQAERVVVCAGANQAIEHATASVDRKGKILFFAVPPGDIAIPALRFWRDEITVTFSYGAAPQDLRDATALIQEGTINVRAMITHKIPLSEIQKGFKLVAEAKESLKVVIVPD